MRQSNNCYQYQTIKTCLKISTIYEDCLPLSTTALFFKKKKRPAMSASITKS